MHRGLGTSQPNDDKSMKPIANVASL